MSSRFNHRADNARSSLFSGYDAAGPTKSQSPLPNERSRSSLGYGVNGPVGINDAAAGNPHATFTAYPSSVKAGASEDPGSFRAATPNKRGQYSDAVLSELESQNDEQLGMMSAKVRMLKDMTTAIGDEIRDSTALAERMNDSFESTRLRIRGTMNRMLRMAESTGVGWRVWLGFFAAVILLFLYVWI